MDQSDVDLVRSAPVQHIQAVLRARHVPLATKMQLAEHTPTATASSIDPATLSTVAERLFDFAALKNILLDLEQTEAAILRELVACGGRANSRDLALYFSKSGLLNGEQQAVQRNEQEAVGTHIPQHLYGLHAGSLPNPFAPQYPAPHPHGVFELALHRLLALGLAFWGKQTHFVSRDYSSGVHDGVLIVPQAVRGVAHELWGDGEDVPAARSGEVGEGACHLQRSLYRYWSLITSVQEGLPLLSSGMLSRAALRVVIEAMDGKGQGEQARSESDVPYLFFLRLLLKRLGLLYERQGMLRGAPAETFFALPLIERARRCYRLWLETPFWNELLSLPEVVVRPPPSPLEPAHDEVVKARHTVVGRLLHEPVGEWRDMATFVARAKLYAPYLLFPRQYGARTERYSIGSNPYGLDFRLKRGWLTHREGWHLVEGGFVRALLAGPLHWLGVVEVNSSEHATRFRLTQGGLLITNEEPVPEQEEQWGRLIVQPNFELVALAPVSEALLVRLDRFAERVGLEHIAQYRLSKASVTRAIQMGLHADAIQRVLEQAAGGEIPQNVRYSLLEWERQARRIELWQGATLLEVDDPGLLDALMRDEAARLLMSRRLSPTLVEVIPRHLPTLQNILWQRDFLPAVAPSPAQESLTEPIRSSLQGPQWKLQEDGLLVPLYALPDLYLAAELQRFSEHEQEGRWSKVTAASLRRGLVAGLKLEQVIRFLQTYCEGGVPPSFLIRLKLWGGGYDGQQHIYIEHAPLLRLSAAVLQDLQVDDELRALLDAEVEQQQRLVHVSAENVERVIALLRERGFTVTE